jgi:dihydroorotate dehydrogenase
MLYPLARSLLFALDPENAHRLTLSALDAATRCGLPGIARPQQGQAVSAMGLQFPNAIGLAAGLDKNGEHIDGLAALGFGFLEVGTVTPRPQPGNPRPRLFRLPEAKALINRMGFNNEGVAVLVQNVGRSRFHQQGGIVGINIGKNFDTPIERASEDYVACLRAVHGLASYVTVNISSPNTKNLRDLQATKALAQLLETLAGEREKLAHKDGRRVPLAVKIAPDLDNAAIEETAHVLVEHGVDAVIATNTTLSREGVAGLSHAGEAGGLSGAPLRERATKVVGLLSTALAGAIPVIAAGGVMSASAVEEKIAAGAALVQIYTGLIYRGPHLVSEAVKAAREAPTRASSRAWVQGRPG